LLKVYEPSLKAAGFVKCYWSLSAQPESHTELVYPTGRIQIIFHYGKPFTEISPSGIENRQPQFALCGQMTTYNHVRADNNCGMIGVVLQTHSAARILGFPLCEATGETVNLADVMRDWKNFSDKFYRCNDDISRVCVIEKFLLSRCRFHKNFHDSFVESCIDEIEKSKGLYLPLKSTEVYTLSERSMQRIFKERTGLSPKKYADIIRFQHAVEFIGKTEKLTTAAYETGFYDQAHFVKEFKRFTGLSPSEFKIAI